MYTSAQSLDLLVLAKKCSFLNWKLLCVQILFLVWSQKKIVLKFWLNEVGFQVLASSGSFWKVNRLDYLMLPLDQLIYLIFYLSPLRIEEPDRFQIFWIYDRRDL